MDQPLVLYSTASLLAYRIARRYYKDVHYVWCSPVFDGRTVPRTGPVIPPTSSPCEIYWTLFEHVRRDDRHSDAIRRNRAGIREGALAKYADGIINAREREDILEAVEGADLGEFRPILFVIPYAGVRRRITEVPVGKRAHALSEERLLSLLPRRLFDVVELGSPL